MKRTVPCPKSAASGEPAPPPRPARLVRAGLIPYREGWALQRRLVGEVCAGGPEALVLCQHPPTVTLGRRATPEQVRVPRAALEAQGVEVIETDRGGGATVHNPGQLVGYPILRLRMSPDLHGLLRGVEEALIRALRALRVEAVRRAGLTGVWVGEEKLASIGMRFERGVTLHGFALNVENDLSLFERIVPCGLEGVRVTSLALLGVPEPARRRTESEVSRAFADTFSLHYQ